MSKVLDVPKLPSGPIVDNPVVIKKAEREVELYHGEPPRSVDGKTPKIFPIEEKCGLRSDKGKCQLKLSVVRVMKEEFVYTEGGTGGQLEYNPNNIKQYKVCSLHGPKELPTKW